MELEGVRLNPLRQDDWRFRFSYATKTRIWAGLRLVSIAMAAAGMVVCMGVFSGPLIALPDEVAESMSYTVFLFLAGMGAATVCWWSALAVLHALTAVFLMLTVKRAVPVATLADVPDIKEFLSEPQNQERSSRDAGARLREGTMLRDSMRAVRERLLSWMRREPASYSATDELAELMLLPHETVSEYHFSGGPVDCSITVECAVCGRVMCPGCGDAFRVDFGSFQAVVTCMGHAGSVAEAPRM